MTNNFFIWPESLEIRGMNTDSVWTDYSDILKRKTDNGNNKIVKRKKNRKNIKKNVSLIKSKSENN